MQMDQLSPLQDDTSFIPADYNHVRIDLLTEEHIPNFPIGSYIVPFRNHETDFFTILQDLYRMLNINAQTYPIEKISLCLSQKNPVKKKSTAQDLRVKLFRQSASGIALQAKLTSGIVEEASANFFYHNEPEYEGDKGVDKLFILMNSKEPFYLSIQKSVNYRKLQELVVKNLNDFYKNNISEGHLKFYKINPVEDQKNNTIDWEVEKELKGIEIQNEIRQKSVIAIEVIKQDSHWPTSAVNNNEFLIIQLDPNNTFRLKFSQIEKYTVKQLLESIKVEKAENFGLKIVNEIFKPPQLVSEIAKYFKEGEGKFIKNISCTLIDQREIFYREMSKVKDDYVIQKTLVTQNKQVQYQRCRELARNRINQQGIRQKFIFTNQQQISPITFYTSSVEVIEGNSSVLLYKGINDNLRSHNFGMQTVNFKNNWKYKFIATLNKSLSKLQPYSSKQFKTLYRGIKGHLLQCQVGKIYIQKQFASTTEVKENAEKWIKNCPAASLLTIQAKTPRLIEEFSIYKSERQALFMPYTYFQVISSKVVEEKDQKRAYIRFREIELSTQYKSNPASYILWIDDKLKEGEKVIGSLECPMHTTFLHQIKSNKELEEWIALNQPIINNQKIKIGVITNMRRVENGVEYNAAGAETIKIVKKKMVNSEIVCYINHIEGTKKALLQNGVNPQQVLVVNQRKDLRKFIAEISEPEQYVQQNLHKSVVIEKKRIILQHYKIHQTE